MFTCMNLINKARIYLFNTYMTLYYWPDTVQRVLFIVILNTPPKNLRWGYYNYTYFTEEETEAPVK